MSDEKLIEELRSAFLARSAGIADRPELLQHLLDQAAPPRRRRLVTPVLAAAAAIAVIAAGVVVQRNVFSGAGGGVPIEASTVVGTPTDRQFPPSGLPSYFVADQIQSTNPWRTSPTIVDSSTLKVAFRLPVALRYAQLSPDGSRVYGIYAGPSASVPRTPPGNMRLDYYDLPTGRLVQLAHAAWITAVSLSADGHTLAFAQITGDVTRVEALNLTSGHRTVFEVPHANQTLAMALSPNGGTLAFTQTRTPNGLFLIDLGRNSPGRGIAPVQPPGNCKNGGYDYPVWNNGGLFALQQCDVKPTTRGQVGTVVSLNAQTLQPQSTVASLGRGGALAMTVVPVGTETLDVLFVAAAGGEGNSPAASLANNAIRVIGPQTNNRPQMTHFAATTP